MHLKELLVEVFGHAMYKNVTGGHEQPKGWGQGIKKIESLCITEVNFTTFHYKKKKTNYTQKKAGIKKMSDEKIYKTHKKQRGQ